MLHTALMEEARTCSTMIAIACILVVTQTGSEMRAGIGAIRKSVDGEGRCVE